MTNRKHLMNVSLLAHLYYFYVPTILDIVIIL